MRRVFTVALVTLVGVLPAAPVFAVDPLTAVYETRGDLQTVFDETGVPTGPASGFLMNLEDWARQYGWQEYPELSAYAPSVKPPSLSISHNLSPSPSLTSPRYIVIDTASGAILAAEHAEDVWPIASITKLMTTSVAIDEGLDVGGTGTVKTVDEVGGARLGVTDGTKFTVRDLLAATLVGSANNAANAVARLCGLTKTDFVTHMNARATALGLTHTTFADPTGIELENVSNAREVAHFAADAFAKENIRKLSGSSRTSIAALNDDAYVRDIKNTNWMLYYPAYDDLYVTAGKTGFLNESGWNVVVQLHPMSDDDTSRSLTIVALGAAGRRESFDDAAALARWAWKSFEWNK